MGLTVLHSSVDNKVDIPTNSRTGTTRYQSPELLDNTINLRQFESYRRADMYAFGLCVWEICGRTEIDGRVYVFFYKNQEKSLRIYEYHKKYNNNKNTIFKLYISFSAHAVFSKKGKKNFRYKFI